MFIAATRFLCNYFISKKQIHLEVQCTYPDGFSISLTEYYQGVLHIRTHIADGSSPLLSSLCQ
nr:MAG TPA: hypothetical protein [Caudoviricetes sp.]